VNDRGEAVVSEAAGAGLSLDIMNEYDKCLKAAAQQGYRADPRSVAEARPGPSGPSSVVRRRPAEFDRRG
jgi:hypothetical protein